MALQYTAAALTSENKVLAHPACVDSIPTSANFEDFVSMGTIAARKAREIIRNTQYIIAIELICAAQAVEFRGWQNLGEGTKRVYHTIRSKIPKLEEDRQLDREIEIVVRELIQNGKLVEAIKEVVSLV
jgi:histidine ammonia-lyase